MATVGSDHILDDCSPAVEMVENVQTIWIHGSSPEAIEDNQSATQIDKISPESSNSISKDDWLISIEKYVDDTTDKPQIQKIPSFLRDEPSNKKCYDPLIVSIGPYHHGKQQLDTFEKLKIPVAKKFVRACVMQVSIQHLYEEVAKVGKSARECYEKGWTGDDNDELFNRMMFLDACFVLQIMYLFFEIESNDSNGTDMEVDPLEPWSYCLVAARRDLFLLENQIPLLVLKVLMNFRFENESDGTVVIQKFLASIMPPQEKEEWKLDMDAPHLLHLLREQLIGSSPEDKNTKKSVKCSLNLVWEKLIRSSPGDKNTKKSVKCSLNLVREKLIRSSPGDKNTKKSVKCSLNLVREKLIQSSPGDKNNEKLLPWTSYRSVKELKSAGIHFRPSETYHVTDVKFKSHLIYGTLTLPPIIVDDSTKSWLLNLAAYEMCPHGPSDALIMSYIGLMDSFIDHADDVKELRKKRIIVNYLGSDDDLAKLFNEIANGLVFDPHPYADVNLQIENHCKSKAQVWMAEWIHNHFRSPWAFLAFLGAILVIALTAVQTYFAVLSYEASRH